MRKTFWLILILISATLIGLAANRYYYDVKGWWILKDTIIWTKETDLKWSDFTYDENLKLTDNIDANIGISARYRITDKIHYKSKTAFVPSKSYVSDTTDNLSLRIVNARFDLCEVYRRKLERKIDSLKLLNIDNIQIEYLEKQDSIYMDKFSAEWSEFLKVSKSDLINELEKMEDFIASELY